MITGIKILLQKNMVRWPEKLKKELANCDKVLDLGCGKNSLIQYCNVPFSVGVELYEPYLEESKEKKIHNKYLHADVNKIEFESDSFDAVLILDLIEHLSKADGHQLILNAKKWAKKKVIILTPNGYLYQEDFEQNPLQKHKCGWDVHELEDLGFNVTGMRGFKNFYNYYPELKITEVKYKPKKFWTVIAELTNCITYFYPRYGLELFCKWENF